MGLVIGDVEKEEKKKMPTTYREWLNETNRNLNRCWCLFNLVGLFLDIFVYHPPVTLVSLLHLTAFLGTSLTLFWRSQAAEMCFVVNNCCRIVLTLLVGLAIIPLTPSFEDTQELHLEKIYEIALISVFEQIRSSWMIFIRAALAIGYCLSYARYKHPFPAFTAVLVNACAMGFHFWVDHYRYAVLYTRYLQRSAQDQNGRQASAKAAAASKQPQLLQPQVPMLSHPQSSTSHRADAAETLAPQHLRASRAASAGPLYQPLHTREEHGGPRARSQQQQQQQQSCGSLQEDSCTQRSLEYVRRCLKSKRVKYTSHLRLTKLSMKVPCSSGPSSLAGEDVRVQMNTLLRAKAEQHLNSELEIVSAVMRAGCIMLVADIRTVVEASSGNLRRRNAGMQASPACAQELGREVVHSAMTWLAATHLPGELHPSTPVALQWKAGA